MNFYSSKVRIRPADTLFSKFVRMRDGECQYKQKCYGHQLFNELQCSHFHSRRKESVRFDPLNADTACASCHQFVHTAVGELWLELWKKKQLGEHQFDLLQLRAESPMKRDDELQKIIIKQLLKDLEKLTPYPIAKIGTLQG